MPLLVRLVAAAFILLATQTLAQPAIAEAEVVRTAATGTYQPQAEEGGLGKKTQQYLIILGFLAIYLGLNHLFERLGLGGPYFRRWPDRKGRIKASKDVGGRFGMGHSPLADLLRGFGGRGSGGGGFKGGGGGFGGGGASGSW
ncbi:hypothetical protein [Pelagibius sp.]|uniref:hypothetical protein n=1 Tax=Pelagibius sp. TaxID=1931238 RepID=UPI002627D537|nr:hypothetical protein [Pelagibius sp.]